eukprot:1017264-Pelagomonas_calceolata.AAC.2
MLDTHCPCAQRSPTHTCADTRCTMPMHNTPPRTLPQTLQSTTLPRAHLRRRSTHTAHAQHSPTHTSADA